MKANFVRIFVLLLIFLTSTNTGFSYFIKNRTVSNHITTAEFKIKLSPLSALPIVITDLSKGESSPWTSVELKNIGTRDFDTSFYLDTDPDFSLLLSDSFKIEVTSAGPDRECGNEDDTENYSGLIQGLFSPSNKIKLINNKNETIKVNETITVCQRFTQLREAIENEFILNPVTFDEIFIGKQVNPEGNWHDKKIIKNNIISTGQISSTPTPSVTPLTPSPTPIILPSPSVTQTPTPTATGIVTPPIVEIQPGDIVINEVNWAGNNTDTTDEWVELFNTTNHEILIGNWLVDNLGSGSGLAAQIQIIENAAIPAFSYYLISRKDKSNSKFNIDPDMTTSSLSLANGGEVLILRTPDNTVIDLTGVTGPWFAGSNSIPKKSMERKNPNLNGAAPDNWQSATTHTNMDSLNDNDEFGTPTAGNGL